MRSESRTRGGSRMVPPGGFVGGVGRTTLPLSVGRAFVLSAAARGVVAGLVDRTVAGGVASPGAAVESRVESRIDESGAGAIVAGAVSAASSPFGAQAPARATTASRGTIDDWRDSGRIDASA